MVAVWLAAMACSFGLLVAAGSAQPIYKALPLKEVSPPASALPRHDLFEARFGAFLHGAGGPEEGSADINAELVFPRLWHAHDGWDPLGLNDGWDWLIPRPHVGAMLNTAGKTSYVYGGALWTLDITDRFFLETFFGGALHNGSLDGDATHAALGCRLLYHLGGSVGLRVMPRWSVLFTFDHTSNGKGTFSNCSHNHGLNDYGLRVSFSF